MQSSRRLTDEVYLLNTCAIAELCTKYLPSVRGIVHFLGAMAGAVGRLLTVAALAGVASTSNSASASRPRLGPFGAAGEKARQPKSTSSSSHDLVKQAVASSTSSSSGGHGVHRAGVAVGECFVEKPHPMSRGCTWQLGYCRVGTNMWTGNCTAWRGDRINKVIYVHAAAHCVHVRT